MSISEERIEAERREFEEWFASDMMPMEADWFKTDDVTGYTHTATAYAWNEAPLDSAVETQAA